MLSDEYKLLMDPAELLGSSGGLPRFREALRTVVHEETHDPGQYCQRADRQCCALIVRVCFMCRRGEGDLGWCAQETLKCGKLFICDCFACTRGDRVSADSIWVNACDLNDSLPAGHRNPKAIVLTLAAYCSRALGKFPKYKNARLISNIEQTFHRKLKQWRSGSDLKDKRHTHSGHHSTNLFRLWAAAGIVTKQ